jgi:transposase
MTITTIGLDTAKDLFQVHGLDESGRAVLRRKLVWGSRCQAFIAGTPVRCVALRSAAER